MFGCGINRFLQFQRLKIFYLESFSLSKVFIIFGVATEGANTLARFLQGDDNGNDNGNGNGKFLMLAGTSVNYT